MFAFNNNQWLHENAPFILRHEIHIGSKQNANILQMYVFVS